MASVRIVVGEQQRAEPRPRPFGIGPADHHEFLALQAFDVDPEAAIAGCVGRIGALGDDALEHAQEMAAHKGTHDQAL